MRYTINQVYNTYYINITHPSTFTYPSTFTFLYIGIS